MDPFENGVDYECEVEILQIEREEGRERNYPIIFINPNGDCHVDSSLEYLLD